MKRETKQNVLCRECYRLFNYARTGVLCRAGPCREVRDEHGRPGPRFLDPRAYGLWRGWPRSRLVLEPSDRCPICRTAGRLVPACPICRRQLDATVGEVEDHVIGVIGATGSGKSHYLAGVLQQFLQAGIGGEDWRVSFGRPEDRRLYRRKFLQPMFRDRLELPPNPKRIEPELRLLLENRATGQRVLLVFRDLGGEVCADPERLAQAKFLHYARGVVLIADPLVYMPEHELAEGVERLDATEVLERYRSVLEAQDAGPAGDAYPLLPRQKFLAVAVTKADLVLAKDHFFWRDGKGDRHLSGRFWEARREEDEATRRWVRERLSAELGEVAAEFAGVGYFFVSSFGFRHVPRSALTETPRPWRVHEPIFALLERFDLAAGAAGESREDDDAL